MPSKLGYYIGSYASDALHGKHRGWIIGKFFDEESDARETDAVEVKYWEFAVGRPNHKAKRQLSVECTLILEGKVEGYVGSDRVTLVAGDFVVIQPRVENNLVEQVREPAKGLTIKAPSNPDSKVEISD